MGLTAGEILELLREIWNGKINQRNLPKNLYYAIAEFLKDGVYKGFGGNMTDFTGKDLELLTALRENIYMFSAAKTYTQVGEMQQVLKDMSEKLVSGDSVVSFKEFKESVMTVYEQYNVNWLHTEYNTAVAQAQNAVTWNQIQSEKDVLPFIQYSAIEDERTSEICGEINGTTLPVDDPFWDSYSPANHWNCRCTLLQLDENATVTENPKAIEDKVSPLVQDVFKSNPGKDGMIFDKDHPYFDVPKADREFAKDNFDLPIPEKDEE